MILIGIYKEVLTRNSAEKKMAALIARDKVGEQ